MIRPLVLCTALVLASVAQSASARTVTLDFLPPQMEPRDICAPSVRKPKADDLSVDGKDIELTDPDRIRYLRRDIRVYTNEDAARYFDFIDALIERRGAIDGDFTPVDQAFDRVDLWLRAGRLEELQDAGLIESLRTRIEEMSNNQRVTLARFYADGVGVERDIAFAQELIREAAYGGNASALLEIARLAQNGDLVEGWDAPLDLTITMAFGGILGGLDRGVCRRAEQIAQAYIKGDVVTANPALARAWFRFAADMGRSESAWRMVEYHLNADAAEQDNIELRHYLKQAVRLGISVSAAQEVALVSSGAVTQSELVEILGFNHPQDGRRTKQSLTPLLQLVVNIDGLEADEDSLYLDYLREITQMAEAPGQVFDRLAGETLVRRGRWAGEAEAISLLEEAVRRGDASAQQRLAGMLVRYRDDPAQVARAETLLMDAVSRFGLAPAMDDLDKLYRCQVTDAPRLVQADIWAANYRASGHEQVGISASDLLALAPARTPETIAEIQSKALDSRSQMIASQAQRVQANPLSSKAELRYWADQVNQSDQALEAFAELEFELARTPAQRDIAIEFFRRVYLNNGVTTALDLAIALVDYNARDPEIAKEVVTLLTMAGNRGEGGAIRLLARLQSRTRPEADVYAQFAKQIEARGDFLALMFAMPYISKAQLDDYTDRAVSLMSCTTKDTDELGSAAALRGDRVQSYQWRQVGLNFELGSTLSKLRLSNAQMKWFDDGAAPDPVDVASRSLAEGDLNARMRLIELTANPDLESYDPQTASVQIVAALQERVAGDMASLAATLRVTPDAVRDRVDEKVNSDAILRSAAESGDVATAYEYAMLLRARAASTNALTQSAKWLQQAAERGHRDAMFEYGYVLGFGLGRQADAAEALSWLDQADRSGHPRAAEVARMVRIKGGL